MRDVPSSECVNRLLTRNSLVHLCLLWYFFAANWQDWCCCECWRLSLCAALNKPQETLNVPAYYHDNVRKLRRCSFFKMAVKVTYFMCGNKKELFPVINQHWALKKSVTNFSVDVKIAQVKLTKCIDCLIFFNKFRRLTRNSQWFGMPWITVLYTYTCV